MTPSGGLHPATVWGIGGFLLLISSAVYRVTPLALEPARTGMAGWEWALWIGSIVVNAYAEGYRGFHQQAAPRVVARGFHLGRPGVPLRHRLFAPLFCMSLFHATRRRLIISWCLYAGIITLVVTVRALPQPWRGIVDAGVVVGLMFGIVSVLYFAVRALSGRALPVPTDVPNSDEA